MKKQCTIDAILRFCTMEMWKTATPPMENRHSRPDGKAAGFPTARKHRFPQLRRHGRLHTFPQRLLLRTSFLSDPDGKRKKRTKKEAGASPSAQTEGGAPALLWKSVQNRLSAPLNRRERPAWENQRAAPGKAATDDFSAHFQPLSAHFFERADW